MSNNYYGNFLDNLNRSLSKNSSELALGLTLFSLIVSIRASKIIEIGRFQGTSTYAMASALKFIDEGMTNIPESHCQRTDVDYPSIHKIQERKLISIEPCPLEEAYKIIKDNNLENYVEYINKRSGDVQFNDMQADLILIDGDHRYKACLNDAILYVSNYLKLGGYFIIHDYYGWYQDGTNQSPIKKVCDKLVSTKYFESILIDTHYMSFMIFRKIKHLEQVREQNAK